MVIEHIFDTIKLIANKTRRGALKTSQIAIAVKAASQDYYTAELDKFRASKVIPSSLRIFVRTVTLPVVAGSAALPSDFSKEISFVSDCGGEGDFLTPDGFYDRKQSFILPPSEESPIAKVQDNVVIVEPDEMDSIDLTYFRASNDFVYAVTVDGDGRGSTFNLGGSTDIEFAIEYSGHIIKRALVYLGVAIQNSDAAQFGMTETPQPRPAKS